MIVLNQHEVEEVNGGIVPVAVAIVGVAVVRVAAPYVANFAYQAVGAAFAVWGYNAATQT